MAPLLVITALTAIIALLVGAILTLPAIVARFVRTFFAVVFILVPPLLISSFRSVLSFCALFVRPLFPLLIVAAFFLLVVL